ncbi:MAG: UDP-glucose/GDP-mannose dehydrogenase family protein [Nitrososphaerota archaeon]|nr:UDP-glucose/GDP-mannose dehydrogenase family protein [Aigarchaeota archaeon]MDW8076192.1 UDP-glucose/GDP-mannose dehydrogenase family protein [Nitrososphaerota archaeon]
MGHKICVIGSGYVGLTMAVCFASKGMDVTCVDVDKERVEKIKRGKPPVYEPGLEEILAKVTSDGTLKATDEYAEGMENTEFSFICVGTPSRPDGGIDLSYITSAAEAVGKNLHVASKNHLVVVKSTVVPGTTSQIVAPILESSSGMKIGQDFSLTFNPEFLREGSAVEDTLHPDRIIIGEHDEGSGKRLLNLYREFYDDLLPPYIITNTVNAELIKYANNAFLATKISFINEIANICQRIPGADVEVVAKGIGLDKRIGPLFLKAGLGYAGPCLPKDLSALITYAQSLGYDPLILRSVQHTNEHQPYKAVLLAKNLLKTLKGKKVALLGLVFKPNTDDVRNSISLKLIDILLKEGAQVTVFDPKGLENAKKLLGNTVLYANSAMECIKDADCCIIVTEWDEFKKLRPEDFTSLMRTPVVVDGRRIYDTKEFSNKLIYATIGYCSP